MFVETINEETILNTKGLLKKNLKNGVKYYDNHKYYETFKEKNENKICEICNGKLNYFNKNRHLESQKHKNALKIKELEK
jgi:hypothetical protein